jgi:hypothetical protein
MCNRNARKKLYVSGVKYQGMKQRERDAPQHTSKKNREYIYFIDKSQQNAREERHIYVSSGAHDETVLITTFEKKIELL